MEFREIMADNQPTNGQTQTDRVIARGGGGRHIFHGLFLPSVWVENSPPVIAVISFTSKKEFL